MDLLLILGCLIASEHLQLSSLLNLGATCKSLHKRLHTGDLPNYLSHSLLEAECSRAGRKGHI